MHCWLHFQNHNIVCFRPSINYAKAFGEFRLVNFHLLRNLSSLFLQAYWKDLHLCVFKQMSSKLTETSGNKTHNIKNQFKYQLSEHITCFLIFFH